MHHSEPMRFVLFIGHVITIFFLCFSEMMDPSTPMGMLMENMEYLPDILPAMMTYMNSEEGVRFGGGIWGWGYSRKRRGSGWGEKRVCFLSFIRKLNNYSICRL